MERLYAGIDLHSNNSVVVVTDGKDRVRFGKRLPNRIGVVLAALEPFREGLRDIALESTFNWYWLGDGLRDAGYVVHLANTAAIHQYEGLKYGDDASDARWLAKLLRMDVLPEGYIYPKEGRAVRDLLRKRGHLVRQRTANILSVQNLFSRNIGVQLKGSEIKKLTEERVEELLVMPERSLAVTGSLAVVCCLNEQISKIEKEVMKRVRLREEFKGLLTVNGIGPILALTIMLETGEISRFARVGNYASYCRCVGSTRMSNNKRKGSGNRKNGNKYLAWAFVEAGHFAVRYSDRIKRYRQRKEAKCCAIVARKAVAHKLARACYYIMKDRVPFDVDKAFS
jgi:transposase